jgi:chemotaxis protein CheX
MQETVAIEAIQAATVRVFATMLEKELICEMPRLEQEKRAAAEGVIAQISVVGASSITCLLCCSAQLACSIAATLLMQECMEVDEEVLDAMAEVANMVLGNVKTDLDHHLGEVSLSIPTVMHGKDFMVHSHSRKWTLLPFQMDGQTFMVKVCFEPPYEPRRPRLERTAIA